MLKCGTDFIEGLSDEPFKRYHGKSVKCINSKKICASFGFLSFILEFSMNTTHLYWLASVKSFAKIILTVFKGNGPHFFVTSGVTVGSRML